MRIQSQSRHVKQTWSLRAKLATTVAWLMVLSILAGCAAPVATARPADYGNYGAEQATAIAANWPEREAGTDEEAATADYIVRELEAMGYAPEIQGFRYIDSDNQEFDSQNILVRIPGTGFVYEDSEQAEDEQGVLQEGNRYFSRLAIVLARMDTAPSDIITVPSVLQERGVTADGIHDNASGVGALLTLARQLRGIQLAYDVLLAFTGAGSKQAAGSQALLYSLGEQVERTVDIVYEVRSIYAGDKLYAHSGHNSLITDQRYMMRRKLYEMVDSASTSAVHRTTGVSLKTNQAGFLIDAEAVRGDNLPAEVVFREITLNDSDYAIFDDAGIPIVYFESYDYDGEDMDDVVESRNPFYAQTSQRVRETAFDQTDIQIELNGPDLLQDRINTVAFLIQHALNKGTPEGRGVKQN